MPPNQSSKAAHAPRRSSRLARDSHHTDQTSDPIHSNTVSHAPVDANNIPKTTPKTSKKRRRPSNTTPTPTSTSLSASSAADAASASVSDPNSSSAPPSATSKSKSKSKSKRVKRSNSPHSTKAKPSSSSPSTPNSRPPSSNTDTHTTTIQLDGHPLYPSHHTTVPFSSSDPHITRIVSWNVCSLRALTKSGAFASYLHSERPHILCVQETKMTPDAVEAYATPSGYSVLWHHSEKKGYSGVAFFVRDDTVSISPHILKSQSLKQKDGQTQLQIEEEEKEKDTTSTDPIASTTKLTITKVQYGIGDREADYEGRVITAWLQLQNSTEIPSKSLCLVCAYVPNAGGKLARLPYRVDTFERCMREYLQSLTTQTEGHTPVIYCGDLNVAHREMDIHNSKGNAKSAGHTPQEREAFGKLLEHGGKWVDCYRQLWPQFPGFTYFSRRFGNRLKNDGKGWRLDYFVIDRETWEKQKQKESEEESQIVTECFVRPDVEGSDHYPLVFDIALHNCF